MPPISIILPLNKNMEEKFAVLKAGPNMNSTTGYNTLHQAQDDGAVVMAYGWVESFTATSWLSCSHGTDHL